MWATRAVYERLSADRRQPSEIGYLNLETSGDFTHLEGGHGRLLVAASGGGEFGTGPGWIESPEVAEAYQLLSVHRTGRSEVRPLMGTSRIAG